MKYDKGFILAHKEDWEKRGRDNGYKQLPIVDANTDENEDLLITKAKEKVFEIEDYYSAELNIKKDALNKFQNELFKRNFKGASDNVDIEKSLSSFSMQLDDSFDRLFLPIKEAGGDYYRLNGQMNRFKAENFLDRDANYPVSHAYYKATMVAIVLLEAILNAYAHQGEGGLLEGAFTAFLISGSNVFLAWGLGLGFRYKNLHSIPYKKILGWLALPTMFILAIYANSLYSTFRAEFTDILSRPETTDTVKAANDAFELAYTKAHTVFFGKIPFSDLISFITFVATVIFSFVAFYEGYNWDDVCPGYGKMDRDLKEKKQKIESLVNELEVLIENKYSEAVDEFTKNANHMSNLSPVQLMEAASDLESSFNGLQSYLDILNSEISNVIGSYRDANKSARGDRMTPAIFLQPPKTVSLLFINKTFVNIIQDYKNQAQEIKEDYQSYISKMKQQCDEFKHRSFELTLSKKKIYRESIANHCSIESAETTRGSLAK